MDNKRIALLKAREERMLPQSKMIGMIDDVTAWYVIQSYAPYVKKVIMQQHNKKMMENP